MEYAQPVLKFQFHKGTIKAIALTGIIAASSYFNSIKVQLKQRLVLIFLCNCLYFNSIKVQLKPGINPYAAFSNLFQFHKGTIKACHL